MASLGSYQKQLEYGSELHDKILSALKSHLVRWRSVVSNRLDAWKRAEELYMAFIPEQDEDARRRSQRESGKPQYTTLVIPYSYATLLTAHTYWVSVFLSRSPIFQFMGRHGESEQQIQAVEALIDYQVQVGQMIPSLYWWLMDVGKYGYGVIGCYWADESYTITRFVEKPKEVLGIPIPGTSEVVQIIEPVQGYEGNKLFNIRPHDFIFDPRTPLSRYQDGEFCGRLLTMGMNEVKRRAARGEYFNVEHIERASASVYRERLLSSPQVNLPFEQGGLENYYPDTKKPGVVELSEIVWEIVPSELGVGDSDFPEKWVFTVAADAVIIGCQPMGEYHNKFPFFVLMYDFDPYSVSPKGMMDYLKPLNDVLDWLFNSHMFNVRKALNDQWVIDPSRVLVRDIKEGGPGRIIRLTPEAYGTDVRTAITQFPVVDITRQHLASIDQVISLIQRVTGVTDNLMGVVYPGGRKTATEVRSSNTFGVNRLKTLAEYFSASAWSPLAQVLVQNSQQHYSAARKMRIVGDLAGEARKFVEVTPESIQGFYDFVPVDGTLPIDRFAQANLWKEILLGIHQSPILAQQFDIGRIFAWMAQLAGLKNINQFKIQVTPDEAALSAAANGSIRPIRPAPPGGAPTQVPGVPELQGVLPQV
jgi:hypothetical protein